MKVIDLITDAMKTLGILSGTETPKADEAADGLRTLNRMLDAWNTERLNIYTISIAAYNLVPGQMTYTIGPGGDFDAARPQRISNANIIMNTVSPAVRVPMQLLDDDQWASIKLQQVPGTIPQLLYNDGSFPLSTIYLWGQPTSGLQLELFTWQALGQFATINDTFSMPPGYGEAILYNLAARLAPLFGAAALTSFQMVVQMAADAKAKIRSMNCQSPTMVADDAVMGTGRASTFNVFTGMNN